MAQFNFEAIGTSWQIDIYQELSSAKEMTLLGQIKNRIELFDKAYSRFRDDSLVTQMSKETGTFALPVDAEPMLALYHDLYLRTDGLFTPMVGDLLSDAGYDKNYSLKQKQTLQTPPTWVEVLEYQDGKLIIKKPVLLDFGAGGKGYLIDLVAKVIEENNIFEYCIDAGGDIVHKGSRLIRIGLENPENLKEVVGVYALQNGSICGSAGNRRAWGNFNHIMNPKTLRSERNILAVWVVAETGLIADALSTCLFFTVPSKFTDTYNFEYMLIKKDHSSEKSTHFSEEIFLI